MDRGARRAAICAVTKSGTQLSITECGHVASKMSIHRALVCRPQLLTTWMSLVGFKSVLITWLLAFPRVNDSEREQGGSCNDLALEAT